MYFDEIRIKNQQRKIKNGDEKALTLIIWMRFRRSGANTKRAPILGVVQQWSFKPSSVIEIGWET